MSPQSSRSGRSAVSGRSSRPSSTPALTVLVRAGVDHEVLGFDRTAPIKAPVPAPASAPASAAGSASDSAPGSPPAPRPRYGAEAAQRLGLDLEAVLKTLMVQCPDGSLAAAVLPVAGTLDPRAAAAALGVKRITMAEPSLAERRTGYVVGGISPVGQRHRVPTVLDASALTHPRVYVSAGQRGLEVGLAPGDLVAVTSAVVADIAVRR